MDQETKYWECWPCGKMMHEDKQARNEFVGSCSIECGRTGSFIIRAEIAKYEQKMRDAKFWGKYWRNKRKQEAAKGK